MLPRLASRRMHRRDALRAAAALTAGTVAGCGAAKPSPSPSPAPPASSTVADQPTGRALAVLADEVQHGPRDRSQVALTFHGQGEARQITALLGEPRPGGARVTVLAVGTWLAANPGLGRQVFAGGHELGNHTEHHENIKDMRPELAYAEISACATAIRTVAGAIGRWFRPSQTRHATATIKAGARRAGYPTCLSYDVDPRDFTDPGPAAIVAATLAAARPGSIVSLHGGHDGTVAAIAPLLAGPRARGPHPVTASELFA
jgi:peptidoglycan/xylan/chitin deacetylase (PgdA/CDA1 family)